MDVSLLSLEKDLKEFITTMNYTESQTSLILLGMLIHRVGVWQYKNGLSSKPILDKINYQGMKLGKLQRLSTDVFNKLKQLKYHDKEMKKTFPALNRKSEKIYADHTMLFHKSVSQWDLSDQENVFYLLSGYALGTRRFSGEEPGTNSGNEKDTTSGGNKNE